MKTKHNPERRSWRGHSYRRGARSTTIAALRELVLLSASRRQRES